MIEIIRSRSGTNSGTQIRDLIVFKNNFFRFHVHDHMEVAKFIRKDLQTRSCFTARDLRNPRCYVEFSIFLWFPHNWIFAEEHSSTSIEGSSLNEIAGFASARSL